VQWVQSTLYGVVLSYALYLIGMGNLHASAVVLPGGAVGFLAEPESGKSTVAATFAKHGYPFLTDDVLALKEVPQGYLAYPGFPFVSLSAQSVDGLLGSAKGPARVPLNQEKQRVAIDGQWASFCPEPVSLCGLFIVSRSDEGAKIELERLSRVEAIGSLMEHTNCLPVLPIAIQRRQMAFVARLTARVPVWRLRYPTGFDHAPRIIQKVLEQTTYGS